MKITYDRRADAAYIKLISGRHQVRTRCVDEDVALDFDERDRLVGIELLGASSRLDLSSLTYEDITDKRQGLIEAAPDAWESGNGSWGKLIRELVRYQKERKPVETRIRRNKNWVVEVGNRYVVLERDRTGNQVRITTDEFESESAFDLKRRRKLAVTQALRDLAFSL